MGVFSIDQIVLWVLSGLIGYTIFLFIQRKKTDIVKIVKKEGVFDGEKNFMKKMMKRRNNIFIGAISAKKYSAAGQNHRLAVFANGNRQFSFLFILHNYSCLILEFLLKFCRAC